jgi:hypothetical protein
MPVRAIVLDANILLRFVLGERVPALLAAHAASVHFLAPDFAFEEARSHLPALRALMALAGTGAASGRDQALRRRTRADSRAAPSAISARLLGSGTATTAPSRPTRSVISSL